MTIQTCYIYNDVLRDTFIFYVCLLYFPNISEVALKRQTKKNPKKTKKEKKKKRKTHKKNRLFHKVIVVVLV